MIFERKKYFFEKKIEKNISTKKYLDDDISYKNEAITVCGTDVDDRMLILLSSQEFLMYTYLT